MTYFEESEINFAVLKAQGLDCSVVSSKAL